jgi:hypothetical protein
MTIKKKINIAFIILAIFTVFATFQWVRPSVMEWRKADSIELLEFQEYTNIEYVSANGWTNKLRFRVTNKDGKNMTVHVTVGKNGVMTVGP